MTLETLLFVAIVLTATLALSTLPERFLRPMPARLQGRYLLMHTVIVILLFILVSLIVQRALFAGIAVNVFLAILVIVSNAKYQALREPMVFSDISMFAQAFKHPRLYFPFLGWPVLLFGPVLIIALIVTLLTLEPALPFTRWRLLTSFGLLVCGYLLLRYLALKMPLTLLPEQDNARFGLLNSLIAYAIQSTTKQHRQEIAQTLAASPFSSKSLDRDRNIKTELPDITVVQSESFFDARRLHPLIRPSILQHYDVLKRTALSHGKLKVPAWGANTMRSEFSFLSGIAFEQMGFYRYYPYQFLYKQTLHTIATRLKSLGYRCICIHPHHSSFFGRDRIFPQMGFDQFIEMDVFKGAERFGPYISDRAVSNKLIELNRQYDDRPLFLFTITMENHGPLHLEQVTAEEYSNYFSDSPQSLQLDYRGLDDLTVYLRHLKNADLMIESLRGFYQNRHLEQGRETLLCFYGDHVPSMPSVYDALNYHDEHSEYLIWSSAEKNKQTGVDAEIMGIESLSVLLERYAVDYN